MTKKNPGSILKDIKRKTRWKFSAEEKIRIVLEGLKGEESVSGICRREGIAPALYYPLADVNNVSIKVAKYNGTNHVELLENNEYGYCSLIKATKVYWIKLL